MATKQTILDQALVLASETGWEKFTLRDLALALDIPLVDIYQHFSQKDDLVEAWFDRADRALLDRDPDDAWLALPAVERVEKAILCWLDALAAHRVLTGQMLLYKLEPGHFHLQAGGVLRISRTVQWFREAAGLRASHGRRIAQEIALSSLYLATFGYWLRDRSENQRNTRLFLRRRLSLGDCLRLWH